MVRRRLLLCAALVASTTALGACGEDVESENRVDSGESDLRLFTKSVTFNDRTYDCIIYSRAQAEEGGVSCHLVDDVSSDFRDDE